MIQARSSERSSVARAVDVGGRSAPRLRARNASFAARGSCACTGPASRATSAGWRTPCRPARAAARRRAIARAAPVDPAPALKQRADRLAEQALDARVAVDLQVAVVKRLAPVDELTLLGEQREHRPRDRERDPLVVGLALAHLRAGQLDPEALGLAGPGQTAAGQLEPEDELQLRQLRRLLLDPRDRGRDQIAGRRPRGRSARLLQLSARLGVRDHLADELVDVGVALDLDVRRARRPRASA